MECLWLAERDTEEKTSVQEQETILQLNREREMEGVDCDSAMESAISNPSCEQKYGDFGKCLQEELLPDPGPIPPKVSEDVPKEEEPSVEKDICREKRSFGLKWGKIKPRTSKPKGNHPTVAKAAEAPKATEDAEVAQTLLDIANSKCSLKFLKASQKEELPKGNHPKVAEAAEAAQTLMNIGNSKSNLPSSPKFQKEPNIGKPQFVLKKLFQKELTPSDIGNNRLVLPKEEAERHFPLLCHEEKTIVMKDYDMRQSWVFKYRLWNLQNKTMHILKQTGEFIKAHELQKGHMVRFYRTPQGDYVVQGIRPC